MGRRAEIEENLADLTAEEGLRASRVRGRGKESGKVPAATSTAKAGRTGSRSGHLQSRCPHPCLYDQHLLNSPGSDSHEHRPLPGTECQELCASRGDGKCAGLGGLAGWRQEAPRNPETPLTPLQLQDPGRTLWLQPLTHQRCSLQRGELWEAVTLTGVSPASATVPAVLALGVVSTGRRRKPAYKSHGRVHLVRRTEGRCRHLAHTVPE